VSVDGEVPVAYEAERKRMVERQIQARGVSDRRVLDALRRVPRHKFVREDLAAQAYDDKPVAIGFGQTISQPYMVGRMTELCQLTGSEKVLEIGSGSGYQTAVLCELARLVFSVECVRTLAEAARERLLALGYRNFQLEAFDGTHGWAEHAPYDAILVAAGAPRVPVLLPHQLAEGGRLVIPVGGREEQRLVRIVRHDDEFRTDTDIPCRFVDLVGRYGWGGSPPEA
jgi:protein-L-isoaspartate(D-aspartate) O-methyltransferase